MPVLLGIDRLRLVMALIAAAALVSGTTVAYAQQADPPKRQQTQPAKPPAKAKPPAATAKPAAPPAAAKAEALPPSQVGIGTLAKQAFMVDPQTSTVMLFKDAEQPMAPSSMSKMMTIYIIFEELVIIIFGIFLKIVVMI